MSAAEAGQAAPAGPSLARRGAVPGGGLDAPVAVHLGDPVREQRALEDGSAVVDLSHLGIVTVSGPDRLSWLDTLSSQWLRDAAPGDSGELLVLDPHGHVEHAAGFVDDGESTWLVTDAGGAAARLAAHLDSMRFMLRVEVRERADVAAVGANGRGDARLGSLPGLRALWRDPWPRTAAGSTNYGLADEAHPGLRTPAVLALVDRDSLDDALAAALAPDAGGVAGRLAGTWAWEAVRVAAARPRYSAEVDERTIPHELDWLRTAVHLDKGCYRGQETIARVVNLGRPPRRIVLLHLDGSEHLLPEAGAPVTHEGREVGRLTSVVRHEELGPIALAVLKRSVPADVELVAGDVAAAQEVLVDPGGESGARPSGPRPGADLRRRDLRPGGGAGR